MIIYVKDSTTFTELFAITTDIVPIVGGELHVDNRLFEIEKIEYHLTTDCTGVYKKIQSVQIYVMELIQEDDYKAHNN